LSLYIGVINAFYNRTEVPAVINTSFNLAGEPILLSAREAISKFLRSDLDLITVKPRGKTRGQRAAKQQFENLEFSPWRNHPGSSDILG
jgi:hypothetical protein